jgi:hypothetical protein
MRATYASTTAARRRESVGGSISGARRAPTAAASAKLGSVTAERWRRRMKLRRRIVHQGIAHPG